MGALQKLRTACKSEALKANGRESSVWIQSTGGQPWRGVPDNLATASHTPRGRSTRTHCWKSKSRCPRSAWCKWESSGRHWALRKVSGFRPPFPGLVYLPALTPASPDLRILKAAPDRLSHPPQGSGKTGTGLRHVRSVFPRGDRLLKRNVPTPFGNLG